MIAVRLWTPNRKTSSIRTAVIPARVIRQQRKEWSARLHPFSPFVILWRYRDLVWQMTKREVIGRYRGSVLGVFWSFLTPLCMLAIYSFVFGFVLKVRWRAESQSQIESSLILFAGLVMYGLFAECVIRAPGLIVEQRELCEEGDFSAGNLPLGDHGSGVVSCPNEPRCRDHLHNRCL